MSTLHTCQPYIHVNLTYKSTLHTCPFVCMFFSNLFETFTTTVLAQIMEHSNFNSDSDFNSNSSARQIHRPCEILQELCNKILISSLKDHLQPLLLQQANESADQDLQEYAWSTIQRGGRLGPSHTNSDTTSQGTTSNKSTSNTSTGYNTNNCKLDQVCSILQEKTFSTNNKTNSNSNYNDNHQEQTLRAIKNVIRLSKLSGLETPQFYTLQILHLVLELYCKDDNHTVSQQAGLILVHILPHSAILQQPRFWSALAHNLAHSIPLPNSLTATRLLHVLVASNDSQYPPETVLNRLNALIGVTTVPTLLISTLSWSLSVSSISCIHKQELDQEHAQLMEETLNVLFAIRMGAKLTAHSILTDQTIMTQLGVVLCDILHLPNTQPRLYHVKLASLNLLMDAPSTYAHYLLVNKAIPHLMTILWYQVTTVTVVLRSPSTHDGPLLLPILIVLTQLCQNNNAVLKLFKNDIFPSSERGKFDSPILADSIPALLDTPSPYTSLSATTSAPIQTSNSDNTNSPKKTNTNKMAPKDAPPGTMRFKLISLMTHIDSNVKRCASEFLWTLCNNDPQEFVERTGFGNAVHMLGIKGLVKLPTKESVD